ncbi:methyltransferase [Caulobacter phage Sansa]|uniref:Methyltransferase n=1 Tax=Caulobacter phage Sansa TaxID=1675600 RepID=A0A0K1LLU1_9CAUD|nr:DNA methyltransferase [Caulobacter phage Sansa]AKU43482.1 methyltransferase [Caulobacter phage Sansa]
MSKTNNRRGAAAVTYPIDRLHWYVESGDNTRGLLDVEKFEGGIWDPCCGMGNIVRAAIGEGYTTSIGTDLKRRVPRRTPWFGGTHDFLRTRWGRAPRKNIVMNPPFFGAKGTEEFIRAALALEGVEKVCVFANLGFLASNGRWEGLYMDHLPNRAYVIAPRPSCPPGYHIWAGGDVGGGTADWIWLVYDLTAPRPTHIDMGRVKPRARQP